MNETIMTFFEENFVFKEDKRTKETSLKEDDPVSLFKKQKFPI